MGMHVSDSISFLIVGLVHLGWCNGWNYQGSSMFKFFSHMFFLNSSVTTIESPFPPFVFCLLSWESNQEVSQMQDCIRVPHLLETARLSARNTVSRNCLTNFVAFLKGPISTGNESASIPTQFSKKKKTTCSFVGWIIFHSHRIFKNNMFVFVFFFLGGGGKLHPEYDSEGWFPWRHILNSLSRRFRAKGVNHRLRSCAFFWYRMHPRVHERLGVPKMMGRKEKVTKRLNIWPFVLSNIGRCWWPACFMQHVMNHMQMTVLSSKFRTHIFWHIFSKIEKKNNIHDLE